MPEQQGTEEGVGFWNPLDKLVNTSTWPVGGDKDKTTQHAWVLIARDCK